MQENDEQQKTIEHLRRIIAEKDLKIAELEGKVEALSIELSPTQPKEGLDN